MKNWQLIALVLVVLVVAIGAWYWYQEATRPVLSIEAPGVSVEVNRSGGGLAVEVDGKGQ